MTWIEGQGDDYFEMQRRIRKNVLSWADSLELTVAAATVISTVFAESSEDLNYRWILSAADAGAQRRIGSEVVLDSLALWNISP